MWLLEDQLQGRGSGVQVGFQVHMSSCSFTHGACAASYVAVL